ncbi:hypothetical protein [Syntrophaceticus schinkii]|nr:hypothetical protein [Syntrophaceticus schinkii]
MSKPVHPTQIRPTRQERRRKQRDLREEQKRQGEAISSHLHAS